MKMKKTTFITQGAVIAAIYAVLVFVFDYSSGLRKHLQFFRYLHRRQCQDFLSAA